MIWSRSVGDNVGLVIDGPDGEIALQFLERLVHFGELDVEGHSFRRRFFCEIGAQEITAFVTQTGAKPFTVQCEGEGFRGDGLSGFGQLDADEAFGASGFFLRGPDFQEQLIARRRLFEEFFEPRPVFLE